MAAVIVASGRKLSSVHKYLRAWSANAVA